MNNYLEDLMTIDGDRAFVRYGDLDWNAFLLDLVDWNEIAWNEAASILKEAFGVMPSKNKIRQYFDDYICTIQKLWDFSARDDAIIEVPVVHDNDSEFARYSTADVLYQAVQEFAAKICLAHDVREREIRRLREAYPELIGNDEEDEDYED